MSSNITIVLLRIVALGNLAAFDTDNSNTKTGLQISVKRSRPNV